MRLKILNESVGGKGTIKDFSQRQLDNIKKLLTKLSDLVDLTDDEIVYLFHEQYGLWERLLSNLVRIKKAYSSPKKNKASELMMLLIILVTKFDAIDDDRIIDIMYSIFDQNTSYKDAIVIWNFGDSINNNGQGVVDSSMVNDKLYNKLVKKLNIEELPDSIKNEIDSFNLNVKTDNKQLGKNIKEAFKEELREKYLKIIKSKVFSDIKKTNRFSFLSKKKKYEQNFNQYKELLNKVFDSVYDVIFDNIILQCSKDINILFDDNKDVKITRNDIKDAVEKVFKETDQSAFELLRNQRKKEQKQAGFDIITNPFKADETLEKMKNLILDNILDVFKGANKEVKKMLKNKDLTSFRDLIKTETSKELNDILIKEKTKNKSFFKKISDIFKKQGKVIKSEDFISTRYKNESRRLFEASNQVGLTYEQVGKILDELDLKDKPDHRNFIIALDKVIGVDSFEQNLKNMKSFMELVKETKKAPKKVLSILNAFKNNRYETFNRVDNKWTSIDVNKEKESLNLNPLSYMASIYNTIQRKLDSVFEEDNDEMTVDERKEKIKNEMEFLIQSTINKAEESGASQEEVKILEDVAEDVKAKIEEEFEEKEAEKEAEKEGEEETSEESTTSTTQNISDINEVDYEVVDSKENDVIDSSKVSSRMSDIEKEFLSSSREEIEHALKDSHKESDVDKEDTEKVEEGNENITELNNEELKALSKTIEDKIKNDENKIKETIGIGLNSIKDVEKDEEGKEQEEKETKIEIPILDIKYILNIILLKDKENKEEYNLNIIIKKEDEDEPIKLGGMPVSKSTERVVKTVGEEGEENIKQLEINEDLINFIYKFFIENITEDLGNEILKKIKKDNINLYNKILEEIKKDIYITDRIDENIIKAIINISLKDKEDSISMDYSIPFTNDTYNFKVIAEKNKNKEVKISLVYEKENYEVYSFKVDKKEKEKLIENLKKCMMEIINKIIAIKLENEKKQKEKQKEKEKQEV